MFAAHHLEENGWGEETKGGRRIRKERRDYILGCQDKISERRYAKRENSGIERK